VLQVGKHTYIYMVDIHRYMCMLGISHWIDIMTCLFGYIYFSSLHSFSLDYTCENSQYIENKRIKRKKCKNEQTLISAFVMRKLKADKISLFNRSNSVKSWEMIFYTKNREYETKMKLLSVF